MVLDKLGESLRNTLRKVSSALFVDDTLLNELVKDIQRALLQSDVNVKMVLDIAKNIKTRFKQDKTPPGLSQKDHLIHIVYSELAALLGTESPPINIETHKPFTIMLVGLFGNGKTTTAGKLAKYYQKRGKRIALLSTDTWRPAAFEQLQQLGKQIDVSVFGDPTNKDPVAIYNQYKPQLDKHDVVIVDTAGRDALNDELIDEITQLRSAVDAQEVFLVIAAEVGQAAQRQAQAFHDSCNVTGVIITRLDGTAKGGGAIAACAITKAPVRFIGVGEKIDAFEPFRAQGFVGRLLGMGDMESLLERTQEAFNQQDAQDITKRLLKGEFTLIDLYEQMQSIKKMGPIAKVMELIPGFSQMQIPKEALSVQEEKMTLWRHIMDSCTLKELEDPSIINHARVQRIAKGSGTSETEVRELLKQHKQAKKMLKMVKGGGTGNPKQLKRMMQKMGKGRIPGI